jgi:hypothetical protein
MAELINNCFIQLIREPQNRLLFSFLPREGIRDQKSANWQQIEVLGRSEPYRSWSASSVRTIGFQLEFYATDRVYEDVQQRVDWLRSLVYPDTETFDRFPSSVNVAPPAILLNVGGLYRNVRCIVKDVSVNWRSPWGSDTHHDPVPPPVPGFGVLGAGRTIIGSYLKAQDIHKTFDMRPMYAIVDLQFEEIDVKLRGGKEIRVNPMRNPNIQRTKEHTEPIPIPRQRSTVKGLPNIIDFPGAAIPGPRSLITGI